MSKPGRIRPVVALAAAYLIALQALLLPLSVAVGGVSPSSLCSAAVSPASQMPAGDSSGCACASGCGMQCCVDTLAGPTQELLAVALPAAGDRIAIAEALFAAHSSLEGTQRARGPPAA
jgi:hypothetical protein